MARLRYFDNGAPFGENPILKWVLFHTVASKIQSFSFSEKGKYRRCTIRTRVLYYFEPLFLMKLQLKNEIKRKNQHVFQGGRVVFQCALYWRAYGTYLLAYNFKAKLLSTQHSSDIIICISEYHNYMLCSNGYIFLITMPQCMLQQYSGSSTQYPVLSNKLDRQHAGL